MMPSVSPSQQHPSMMGNAFNLTSITLLLTGKQIFSIKFKCKILLTLTDHCKWGPDCPRIIPIKNYNSSKKMVTAEGGRFRFIYPPLTNSGSTTYIFKLQSSSLPSDTRT